MRECQYLKLLKEQAGDRGMGDLHSEIINYFKTNPNPSDNDIHKLAEKMGIDSHELEEHIYMILGNLLTKGESEGFTGTYDKAQLEAGTEVELREHTPDPLIAEKIAKDHLAEIPDYYTRLEKMESEAGVSNYEKE